MAKKKSGLRRYAKAAGGGLVGGGICKTCRDWPQVEPAIREYLEAVESGDPEFRRLPVATDSDGPSLLTFLREEFGYDLCGTALRRHVKRCTLGKAKATRS